MNCSKSLYLTKDNQLLTEVLRPIPVLAGDSDTRIAVLRDTVFCLFGGVEKWLLLDY